MIELARHIEILLLENDCVIVPDLGGFIAHYQPARYVQEENLYLPPVRTIGFNPQLTLNDGLLVQSYMQAYHTDFPDATRRIAEEVADLKEKLYTSGCAEMHGIGILHYNVQGNYEFHPNESGALSPSLYGLGSFSIHRLEYLTTNPSATVRELHSHDNRKKRSLRIRRQWIGNAVAAAAAILLFFFLSVPVENTYIDKGNYASLGTDGLFDAIRSQSLATTLMVHPQQPQKRGTLSNQNTLKPVTVKVEKVAPATQSTSTDKVLAETKAAAVEKTAHRATPATPAQTTGISATTVQAPAVATKQDATAKVPAATPKPTVSEHQPATPAAKPAAEKKAHVTSAGKYCIIVSSLPTEKDAKEVRNNYQRQGFADACILEGGNRYRIALHRFADKKAAYQKLNELRKTDAFKQAWVLTEK